MKTSHALIVIVSSCLLTFGCQADQCDPTIVSPHFDQPVEVVGPFSIDEVEKRQTVEIIVDGRMEMRPFGHINSEWEELKSEILPGDCLFFFRSDDATWEALHGREGYILFRDQRPIDGISTKRS